MKAKRKDVYTRVWEHPAYKDIESVYDRDAGNGYTNLVNLKPGFCTEYGRHWFRCGSYSGIYKELRTCKPCTCHTCEMAKQAVVKYGNTDHTHYDNQLTDIRCDYGVRPSAMDDMDFCMTVPGYNEGEVHWTGKYFPEHGVNPCSKDWSVRFKYKHEGILYMLRACTPVNSTNSYVVDESIRHGIFMGADMCWEQTMQLLLAREVTKMNILSLMGVEPEYDEVGSHYSWLNMLQGQLLTSLAKKCYYIDPMKSGHKAKPAKEYDDETLVAASSAVRDMYMELWRSHYRRYRLCPDCGKLERVYHDLTTSCIYCGHGRGLVFPWDQLMAEPNPGS